MALWLYIFWTLVSGVWVWLALAPLPEAPPVWLVQTRDVCFGTLDNGLPDVHGWVSLGALIPMLLALLVLMGSDLRRQLLQLAGSGRGFLLAVGLLFAPCLIAGYVIMRVADAPRLLAAPELGPLPDNYPSLLTPAPAFSLLDQNGRRFQSEQLKGEVTLLTFAYAHCQTVCPGLLENLRRAARSSGCRLVVITLDPRRDTCGSLEGLARYWDLPSGSLMLGGEVEEIERATQAFEVPFQRDPKTGEIVHPALVFVFDAQARLRYRLSSPSSQWLQDAVARAGRRQ